MELGRILDRQGTPGVFRFGSTHSEFGIFSVGGYDGGVQPVKSASLFENCPDEPELNVYLADYDLRAGDTFKIDINVNYGTPGTSFQSDDIYPMFGMLEVFGEYFFAPSFGTFDFYALQPSSQEQVVPVVPEFTWPSVPGNVDGLMFYAATTNKSMNWLYGNLAYASFGWSN